MFDVLAGCRTLPQGLCLLGKFQSDEQMVCGCMVSAFTVAKAKFSDAVVTVITV